MLINNLLLDLRLSARALSRRVGFTATVVLTLALAIGANAAVLSLLDVVLFRPLTIPDAKSAVAIFRATKTSLFDPVSLATFNGLVQQNKSFSQIAAFTTQSVSLRDGNTVDEVQVQFVTDNYFQALRIRPALGRFISPALGPQDVVVLSNSFWVNRFGKDTGAIGKNVRIGERQLTVVGVAAPDFHGTNLSSEPDMWMPVAMISSLDIGYASQLKIGDPNSELSHFLLIGRLRPGVSMQQASLDLNAIEHARLAIRESSGASLTSRQVLSLVSANNAAASIRDRTTLVAYLRLLASVVAVTMLLACLNVANLMIVRGRERYVELGIRSALGATPTMIARQLCVESLLLAVAGGALGLTFAIVALKGFASFQLPGGIVIGNLDVGLNGRIVAATCLLTIACALVFGLYPAWSGARGSVYSRMRVTDASVRSRFSGRGALLAVQVAIALTLLTGATTFLESLRAGLSTNLGFDSELVAAVSIRPNFQGSREENALLYSRIVERASHIPGVSAAAATSHVPLEGARALPFTVGPIVAGRSPDAGTVMFPMTSVTTNYFNVLGVPILEGRSFAESDVNESERVTIVNQSTARALWPGESAVGKQITFWNDLTYTVVGVVQDIKYSTIQDKGVLFAYAPLSQEDTRARVTFIARTARPDLALPQLQAVLAEVAPQLLSVRPRRVKDQINTVLMPQRFGAMLLSTFALVALVLSSVGIYGTVSFTVARRTRELGIRMALGGSRWHVVGTVLRDVAVSLGIGVLIGALATGGTHQLISHLLQDVGARGVSVFFFATAVLCVIAIGASSVPARRAARIDPMKAIRPS